MIIIPDYQEMYFGLMAKISDAVEILTTALQKGEEAYIADTRPQIKVVKKAKETEAEE